ncbi:MAG: hypothetical protein E7K67_02640 [Peptostreptococcaceae bacterium]|nr:hypothetical protein [Peptostreptococcaceae bacterium]
MKSKILMKFLGVVVLIGVINHMSLDKVDPIKVNKINILLQDALQTDITMQEMIFNPFTSMNKLNETMEYQMNYILEVLTEEINCVP